MGALNDAQTAAMLAFLKTRRGDKELKPDELVEAMLKYLKAKGIPVNELETLAPGASEEDKEDFIQVTSGSWTTRTRAATIGSSSWGRRRTGRLDCDRAAGGSPWRGRWTTRA